MSNDTIFYCPDCGFSSAPGARLCEGVEGCKSDAAGMITPQMWVSIAHKLKLTETGEATFRAIRGDAT